MTERVLNMLSLIILYPLKNFQKFVKNANCYLKKDNNKDIKI